jgi:hypothetical protein
MSGKDNIISFADRLRAKEEAGTESHAEAGAEEPGRARDTGDAEQGEALPGKLVWLRCPACDTLEYTEVVMAGGRTHNVCGNQVEEVQLDIDVRAEYTIAELNLERLEILAGAVEAQRQRFREYQERMRLIAGGEVASYPVSEEMLRALPVAEMDAMGLLVSTALHNPARRFESAEEEAPSEIEAQTEGGAAVEGDAPVDGNESAKGEGQPRLATDSVTDPVTDPDPRPPKP